MLDRLSDRLNNVVRSVSGKSRITEQNIADAVEEIKVALLEADVNLKVVRRFVSRTVREASGESVLRSVSPGQQFVKVVYDKLVEFLGDERQDLALRGPDVPSVILFAGLQGSGKTTSAAKLALRLKKEGRRPLLVAADLVRPAAVDQLQQLGERIGIPVEAIPGSKDPKAVVKAGLARAKKEQLNVVIIDTAGRMQVDEALMEEIRQVSALAKPDERILVADAMTGQNAVEVARAFHESVDLTGVILSKFDSDTRGGAALSIKTIAGTPIKFIGTGEGVEDLEPFYPERIASRILGMGDVVSLVEKAQETIGADDAERLQKKIRSATFTLEDYLEQFQRVRKMGSVQSLLEMIPGMKGNIDPDQLDMDQMKREEAIILSMTREERHNHRIIGMSRRKRIAAGSGSSVFEVGQLIKRFDKMRAMMKKVSKNKKYQSQLMAQMGHR
ncbi:signal recognition particle subunit FFH/SRP54 (srp54) [Alkalispirochaeta americana]|uniref:Signal recognition particle protein n=1 Tax=Alkalispirochaeta americana TaxID=159291 RepID=A0A1N6X3F0_9SPIO|nr:signal recognition particle protein [Alkalispirochaeta americana]SIQ96815.1 signal recognition particle subunit FFH/SRP54 (srp54) [Alkalispirochaeta americana]